MTYPTLGIVGGMGPAATADLMAKIVAETPASRDQDHIRVLVDSNPAIPDRTQAILGDGPSPAPLMAASARLLERAGAEFLVIACNTAHAYVADVERAVGVPVLSMLRATVDEVLQGDRSGPVGVLATTACLATGIYQSHFTEADVRVITLDDDEQVVLMNVIGTIKRSGKSPSTVAEVRRSIDALTTKGAGIIVAGCTEVPLVLSGSDLRTPIVSSTDALARAAVAYAMQVRAERSHE